VQHTNQSNILAVIVLYNTKLEDSTTFNTLRTSIETSSLNSQIEIVVYDNSSVSQAVETTLNILYVHDAENGGVSKAYNKALGLALQRGCDWLLLLDQDSELPLNFIDNCFSDLQLQDDNPAIVAIVPTVVCGSEWISPCKVGWGGKLYPIRDHSARLPLYEITAINSGALVKVAFLDSIGGFNNEYWLDMLDHWLFRTIYCTKMNVAIGNNKVCHDLSIQNYATISFARYKNIITAESRFNLTDRTFVYKTMFRFRLLMRVFKMIFIHKRADLSTLTLSYVLKGRHLLC